MIFKGYKNGKTSVYAVKGNDVIKCTKLPENVVINENTRLNDDLGYHPQTQPGMHVPDFEEIVHTTIEYIQQKYPREVNSMDRWLSLIGEEYGELCQAILDGETNNVVEEATQTIAAIYLMLEQFCNLKAGSEEQHEKQTE